MGAVLLGLAPAAAGANGFASLAKDLSRAARRGGLERVAILPFLPADDSSAKDGWTISEKLITQVVRGGKVQVVERSQLRSLLEEHALGRAGLLDQARLKQIGKVLSVDALVVGSFVTLGSEAVVNARLIHLETGVILSASERRVEREWFDVPGAEPARGPAALWVPVPAFPVEAPGFPEGDPTLRDAPEEESCANAAERVDRLESQILDLKARYWAGRLSGGLSSASLKSNPGSTITDPELKKAFFDRLRYWYGLAKVPELSPAEIKRFIAVDERAYSLYSRCGV